MSHSLRNTPLKYDIMEGYKVKDYGQPVKRYCQTMDLRDNPELIAEYKRRHSQVWPEIIEGIKAVGILDMQIFLLGHRLMMIVDTPLDFQWDEAMSRLATLPRQQEWETYMSLFQDCSADATSDEKWQMMERIFCL